jgi:C-terminal processing protease CtpA/Prc
MFHKEDQIISVNGTYVKDLSLSGVVELLANSGSRVKIEFLTVHALNDEEEGDSALSDRFVPLPFPNQTGY